MKLKFDSLSLLYFTKYIKRDFSEGEKSLSSTVSLQEWNQKSKTIKMIFRFLQLLCEGHNLSF